MRFIYLVLVLLFTSCGLEWQYTTLNHAAQVDAIYRSSDYRVNTVNYNFSLYSFDQPFIWGNPMFRNRYNFYNPYLGYNSYWNRWDWYHPYNNWYWNRWDRPYNYWNYYSINRRTSNISYINGYRNTTRTPSVSNRTRSATTRSQVQNRTYTPTNRTISTPTRSTTRSTTTRSVVRPSTTRSTTRSTSPRRSNINRKN